jgi:hypothetical protein
MPGAARVTMRAVLSHRHSKKKGVLWQSITVARRRSTATSTTTHSLHENGNVRSQHAEARLL